MPPRIYASVITVGDIDVYSVFSDPNGVLSARIGSLAIRSAAGFVAIWQNTDGGTNWVAFVGASAPGGVITVAQAGGGDFTTIGAALAVAVSGNIVEVYPGTYNESVTVPTGVLLVGHAASRPVVIAGADTTSTRVTLSAGSTLRELTVVAPSASANPAVDASGLAALELAIVNGVVFQGGGGSGPLLDGPGAGLMVCKGCRQNGGSTTGTAFRFGGGGSLYLEELLFGIGSSAIAVEIADVDAVVMSMTFTPSLYSATDGICISSALAQLQGSGVIFPTFGTPSIDNAFHVAADGCKVALSATHLSGAVTGLLVDGGLTGVGTEFSLVGELRLEQVSAPSGWMDAAAVLGFMVDDGVKNDPSARTMELAVGTMDNPSELTVGTGDSLVCLSAWLYDDSAGTFTDVTGKAQSRTGSTFTMLADLGDRLYIGFDRPFAGIKTLLTQLAVQAPGRIQPKIWTGAAYEDIVMMVSGANHPYVQVAAALFESSLEEQVRLDVEGNADPASGSFGDPFGSWSTEDPMSLGTPYFYLVLEIEGAALTTAPIIERLKCGLQRAEMNADGFVEKMGRGEGERKSIPGSERRGYTGGGSPAAAVFDISTNVTVTVPTGVFSNNQLEGFLVKHTLPRGVDSSRMFQFVVEWVVDGAVTGDVELEILVSNISPGANIDNGVVTQNPFQVVHSVTASDDDGVYIATSFWFWVEEALAGDTLTVTVFRDARAGNSEDTLAANIKIWDTDLRAVRWTAN